jgi:hypothetical protein
MAAKDMDETRTPSEEDAAAEAVVLQQLLALHPTPLSFEELLRELGDGEDFARRDALDRAVRGLTATGLLQRNGKLLAPSRAALHFDELLCD